MPVRRLRRESGRNSRVAPAQPYSTSIIGLAQRTSAGSEFDAKVATTAYMAAPAAVYRSTACRGRVRANSVEPKAKSPTPSTDAKWAANTSMRTRVPSADATVSPMLSRNAKRAAYPTASAAHPSDHVVR